MAPYLREKNLKNLSEDDFQLFLSAGILFMNILSSVTKQEIGNVYVDRWMFLQIINTYFGSHILSKIVMEQNVSTYLPLVTGMVVISSIIVDVYCKSILLNTRQIWSVFFLLIGLALGYKK